MSKEKRVLLGTYFMDKPQGTQTWTYTLAVALHRLGHEVHVTSFRPGYVCDELNRRGIIHLLAGTRPPKPDGYDLTICNHNPMLRYLQPFRGPIGPVVCFIHGIHPKKEQPIPGADYYVAISEEVKGYVEAQGFKVAEIIPNFVDTARWAHVSGITPKEKPWRLLYLSHYRKIQPLLERVCKDRGIELMLSPNNTMRIDDLVRKADVVVSLGRGIAEALAAGRGAFVGDHSTVIGEPIGDGLLDTFEKVQDSVRFNFNGKATRTPLTEEFVHSELDRWDYEKCQAIQAQCWKMLDVNSAIERIFNLAGG